LPFHNVDSAIGRSNSTARAVPSSSTPIPHGIVDGWYVDAEEFAKEDKSLFAAACRFVSGWPEGEHSAELLGPGIRAISSDLNDVPAFLQPRCALSIKAVEHGAGEIVRIRSELCRSLCILPPVRSS
jgi:hypothetical protein